MAEIFHLREQARDSNVAHLQIACDAAVAVAHKYNSRNAEYVQLSRSSSETSGFGEQMLTYEICHQS